MGEMYEIPVTVEDDLHEIVRILQARGASHFGNTLAAIADALQDGRTVSVLIEEA